MKKFLCNKFYIAAAIIALIGGTVAYTQTSFTEIANGGLLFRQTDPQARVVGTWTVRNRLGTASGHLASARPFYNTTAATQTLTYADCGAVIFGSAASGTQVFTLPDASDNSGCQFTFVSGHASGEILVNSEDGTTDADCVITSFAAVGADADTGIVSDSPCRLKNTAGTNAIGDSLTLISDGTGWKGLGITSGIWAAQ